MSSSADGTAAHPATGLVVRDVSFSRGERRVLTSVDLRVAPGEVVGLQGPSGIGKSTLGRLMAGLLQPTHGTVSCDGQSVGGPTRTVQYLVQDPAAAMNPRWRVDRVLAEAGPTWAGEEALVDTGWRDRYPHEISGGQLQRVNLARALRARPRYLVADEITASLDALTQADVWRHLLAVAAEREVGVLCISHDPALLARIADRVEHLGPQLLGCPRV